MLCDQLSLSALKKLSSLKARADGFSNKVEALLKSPSIAFINSSEIKEKLITLLKVKLPLAFRKKQKISRRHFNS